MAGSQRARPSRTVAELGPQDTGILVGTERAALVGGDGVVRDDSWIEVFEAASGPIAIVQASAADYPEALARALPYPTAQDEDGGTLNVRSGALAIFSAAVDGTGPHSVPLLAAQPGPVPPVHDPPSQTNRPVRLGPVLSPGLPTPGQ